MLMEQSLTMSKIIRERYEAGTLVSREIEGSGVSFFEIAKLCAHLVIAASIAVIAALNVIDSLAFSDMYNPSGMRDTTCRSPGIQS